MDNLLDKTIALLKVAPYTRREISAGAGVGYEWLNKLAQGHIENPGVLRVQSIHDYLTRRLFKTDNEDAA